MTRPAQADGTADAARGRRGRRAVKAAMTVIAVWFVAAHVPLVPYTPYCYIPSGERVRLSEFTTDGCSRQPPSRLGARGVPHVRYQHLVLVTVRDWLMDTGDAVHHPNVVTPRSPDGPDVGPLRQPPAPDMPGEEIPRIEGQGGAPRGDIEEGRNRR